MDFTQVVTLNGLRTDKSYLSLEPSLYIPELVSAANRALNTFGGLDAIYQRKWFGRHFQERPPETYPAWGRGAAEGKVTNELYLAMHRSLPRNKTRVSLGSVSGDVILADVLVACVHLFAYESRLQLGRPANSFNDPTGKGPVSSWGVHQFLGDAWINDGRTSDNQKVLKPYGNRLAELASSPLDELVFPIAKYTKTWIRAIQAKKHPWEAIACHHSRSSLLDAYLTDDHSYKVDRGAHKKKPDGSSVYSLAEYSAYAINKLRLGAAKLRELSR